MKLSGTIQNVTQTTLGSQLAADVLIGDSTVTVVDGSDFNEDDGTGTGGGTLSIGGSQVDYTTIDNDTNIITLASTLSVNASQGDRVDVWDPSTSAASVDTVAFVALAGGTANDDFVQASVAHALALTLDVGIRAPGMGESSTIEELTPGDGEWVVVDVRGKKATVRASASGDWSWPSPAFGTPADLSDLVFSQGDISCFAYDGGGIDLLQDGYYEARLSVSVQALDAGVVLAARVTAGSSTFEYVTGWGGDVHFSVITGPFYAAASDFDVVTAEVSVVSGSVSTGVLQGVDLILTRLN